MGRKKKQCHFNCSTKERERERYFNPEHCTLCKQSFEKLNKMKQLNLSTAQNMLMPLSTPMKLEKRKKVFMRNKLRHPLDFFDPRHKATNPVRFNSSPLLTLCTKVLFSHHSTLNHSHFVLVQKTFLFTITILSSFNCLSLHIQNYLIRSLIMLKTRSHLTNIFMTSFKILIP